MNNTERLTVPQVRHDHNAQRAGSAEKTLGFYFAVKNPDVLPFEPDSEGYETLVDLLTDLRHWAAGNGEDFDVADRMAELHFQCELDESAQEGGAA